MTMSQASQAIIQAKIDFIDSPTAENQAKLYALITDLIDKQLSRHPDIKRKNLKPAQVREKLIELFPQLEELVDEQSEEFISPRDAVNDALNHALAELDNTIQIQRQKEERQLQTKLAEYRSATDGAERQLAGGLLEKALYDKILKLIPSVFHQSDLTTGHEHELVSWIIDEKLRKNGSLLSNFDSNGTAKLSSWLHKVTQHAALDYAGKLRRERSAAQRAGRLIQHNVPSPTTKLRLADIKPAITQAINDMQGSVRFKKHAEVVNAWLKLAERLDVAPTDQQLADELNVPKATIQRRRAVAFEYFRRYAPLDLQDLLGHTTPHVDVFADAFGKGFNEYDRWRESAEMTPHVELEDEFDTDTE